MQRKGSFTITLILIAAALILAITRSADATFFNVDSQTATLFNPLDTGINLQVADMFEITVDPNQVWGVGSVFPLTISLTCNANGIGLNQLTMNGASFNYGAMVGRIGNGDYFLVGTNFGSQVVTQTGHLQLMCWDNFNLDNSGSIGANINATPIPPTVVLLGSGFVGLLALGWRKRNLTP